MSENTKIDDDIPGSGFSASEWFLLILLMLVYICYQIDKTIVLIFLEPIKTEFKLSDAQLGLVAGFALAAGTLVASLPLGTLADRTSRKILLSVCVAIWSALTMVCGALETIATGGV